MFQAELQGYADSAPWFTRLNKSLDVLSFERRIDLGDSPATPCHSRDHRRLVKNWSFYLAAALRTSISKPGDNYQSQYVWHTVLRLNSTHGTQLESRPSSPAPLPLSAGFSPGSAAVLVHSTCH